MNTLLEEKCRRNHRNDKRKDKKKADNDSGVAEIFLHAGIKKHNGIIAP